ncbi:MAG TPA: carbohydrate ABC transporter permease [Chloroflexota bacterium]|nr:carbohydrate ABC transporter permease [Chloroflexota bacterium]
MIARRVVHTPPRIGAVIRGVLLAVLLLYTLLPVVWMVGTSLKTRALILSTTPVLLFQPDLTAYQQFLSPGKSSIVLNLVNSLSTALASTAVTIVLGSLAAYGFSRYRFPGQRALLLLMLATRLLPPLTAVLPLFLLLNSWSLIDTRAGLILIYTGLAVPLATWMMKAFIDGIPVEYEEAAMIDGASRLRVLGQITLPLAAPGVVAVAILTFVLAWNDFLFAFIFTSVNARTMPVLLSQTVGELDISWQTLASLATIVIVPPIVLSLAGQKSLVRGLVGGGLK